MNKAAKNLLANEDDCNYGIVGNDTCMGDHKVNVIDLDNEKQS
jgi:hypothetical protein